MSKEASHTDFTHVKACGFNHGFFMFALEIYFLYLSEENKLSNDLNTLKSKLNSCWYDAAHSANASPSNSKVSLSLFEFTCIMSTLQLISEKLLDEDGESIRKQASATFKDSPFGSWVSSENWDIEFIKGAQSLFDDAKKHPLLKNYFDLDEG